MKTKLILSLVGLLAASNFTQSLQAQYADAIPQSPSFPVPDLLPTVTRSPSLAPLGLIPAPVFDPNLSVALEAVSHAKGSQGITMSLKDAESWLKRPQGHGAIFEQLVANEVQRSGRNVAFTKAGNVGTDLRAFPGNGSPMTFIQAKATANALNSGQEALLDGLAFAGKQANRPKELLAGRIAFEGYIPSDQFEQLIRDGWLNLDGTPTEKFIKRSLERAAKQASGTGETATRLRGSLKDAEQLLPQMRIRPGPAAYDEVLQTTRTAVKALRTAISKVGLAAASKPVEEVAHLLSPAWVVTGKALKFVPLLVTPIHAWQGICELKDGQIVEGSANLTGSGLSAGAEVAILSGRAVLSGSLLTATAFIDGGVDLYKGVTQTNTDRIVIGGVKCAAASAMTAGLATGQPVIIVAGTMVYIGVVVTDTVIAAHEVEKNAVIHANQTFISRTGPFVLAPAQYKGIGLSQAEEKAIGAYP